MEANVTPKILFAEDDPHEHETLRSRLEELGYEITLAPNILDAFSILVYDKNRLKYDLVLVDLMMDAGFLGNQHPYWRRYGGLCLCEEIFENSVNIKLLVYSHVIDENAEDGVPILRYLEERNIPFVRKTRSTAILDGLDRVISQIVEMSSPIKNGSS